MAMVYDSALQAGVRVPQGIREDMLRGTLNHLTVYVKLKRKILFCNKLFILDVDYGLCMTSIIHQQVWGYKVENKLHLGGMRRNKC
jgi:hypothetical protein